MLIQKTLFIKKFEAQSFSFRVRQSMFMAFSSLTCCCPIVMTLVNLVFHALFTLSTVYLLSDRCILSEVKKLCPTKNVDEADSVQIRRGFVRKCSSIAI